MASIAKQGMPEPHPGPFQNRTPDGVQVEFGGGESEWIAREQAPKQNGDRSPIDEEEHWLRMQNAELERRVAERTTELRRSNEALELATRKLTENAKDLEEVISQRTLALQEIVGSLEQFCYTIAHDLRAPLRTMHGFSSALLE